MPQDQVIIEETPDLVLDDSKIRVEQLKTGIKPSWNDEKIQDLEKKATTETSEQDGKQEYQQGMRFLRK